MAFIEDSGGIEDQEVKKGSQSRPNPIALALSALSRSIDENITQQDRMSQEKKENTHFEKKVKREKEMILSAKKERQEYSRKVEGSVQEVHELRENVKKQLSKVKMIKGVVVNLVANLSRAFTTVLNAGAFNEKISNVKTELATRKSQSESARRLGREGLKLGVDTAEDIHVRTERRFQLGNVQSNNMQRRSGYLGVGGSTYNTVFVKEVYNDNGK